MIRTGIIASSIYKGTGGGTQPPAEPAVVETINLVDSWNYEGLTGDVLGYNGHNGTISGTVTRGETGIVNNCFDFNGGAVTVPHSTDLWLRDTSDPDPENHKNKNIAHCQWVIFESVATDQWLMNKRGGGAAASSEYQFMMYQNKIQLHIWNTDGSTVTWISGGQNPVVGEKRFYAFYTDVANNTITVIRDGAILEGATTGTFKTINTTTSPIVFGKAGWFNGFYFYGKQDEPRIWIGDTVPTANYFIHEYNNGNGITI